MVARWKLPRSFSVLPGIGNDIENLVRGISAIHEHLTKGRIGRLHGTFLLAVTKEEVLAFKFLKEGDLRGPGRNREV